MESAAESVESDAPAPATAVVAFGFATGAADGWHGEIATPHRPADLRQAVLRLIDLAASEETLHWGRNVIYRSRFDTAAGPVPLAVKQFTNDGVRARWERRLRGSKAQRSWRVARALAAAGIATPEPVALVESDRPEGPSYYACRHLDDVLEARYLLRAVNAGTAERDVPGADVASFLVALGHLVRRLHDAGFWHRDLSSGNVLIRWPPTGGEAEALPELFLLDLNRTRVGRVPSLSERSRDLSRMMIFRPADQELFLAAYWGPALGRRQRRLYHLYQRSFLAKNAAKRALRSRTRHLVQAAKDLVLPRGTHGHIPPPAAGASTRDRVVWDHLSDQPHLHAGKLRKLASRLSEAGSHAGLLTVAGRALPGVWRRYRELAAARYAAPVPFSGLGVALRPRPEDPEGLLAAVDELGIDHLLLRLHPWEHDHAAEEQLAAELAERGHDLTFALPQNRELVRDPPRWRAAVEELAERFTPYGRRFQVGQAVNRSKWGVWSPREYLELAATAAEILRRRPGVEVLGPAVIDFEPYVTAGLVNHPAAPRFDALASLLYVDRRGAPENRQGGFDTLAKLTLLQAIADTARRCAPRSWVTEVNWPLREGPHSPAGRLVAVDEDTQADYLVRYYLLALTSGCVERVYWWQLAARGYGLLAPQSDGALRRRPSFRALAVMARELAGAVSLGPPPGLPPGARGFRFHRPDGGETSVVWAVEEGVELPLPEGDAEIVDRDGARGVDLAAGARVRGNLPLGRSPLYLRRPSR